MAYNFKKINDVPVVEAMKDNLNVFIEDGGKMAKIPANKMIPEDVALKSDIPESIPVPATAEVGQVIAVKAVDENGKPTEWEAANVGGGSGGDLKQLVIYKQSGDGVYECNMSYDEIVSAIRNRILISAQIVYTDLEPNIPNDASFGTLENVAIRESDNVPNIKVDGESGEFFILRDGTVTDQNPNGAPR